MRPTLLIIIPGFAKNEDDTTCIPLAQSFIKTLNKNHPGIEVIVITLDYPLSAEEYHWFGNRIIPMNGSKITFRPVLWLKLYRLMKKLSRQKRTVGILNFWCADNALVSHYFSRWNNIKQFTWLQGQDARRSNKILAFFSPKKESLIALSDSLAKEFIKNHSVTSARIIYPGISPELFQASTSIKKDVDIIGVGSLIPLKQYRIFIEVVEALKSDHPHIKTLVVGKGPQENELRRLIGKKKLESNVELTGELSHPETLELVRRSKILLHPSSYEGYGMVCLEGLAAGCRVISFISPEAKKIPHWDVVPTKEDMIIRGHEILTHPPDSYNQVIIHTIDDCVNEILELYGFLKGYGPVDHPATTAERIFPAMALNDKCASK